MDQKPSIGRIIHMTKTSRSDTGTEKVCIAAIVTYVYEDDATLDVILFDRRSNPYPIDKITSEDWHWPERI